LPIGRLPHSRVGPDERYVRTNETCSGVNLEVLPDGDIIFPVGANVDACCRIVGADVREVFPSCPQIMTGLIVSRGKWNAKAGRYDLTPSRPVVISDLKSSRGVDEPKSTSKKWS